jgi:group I intron endonuclease
MGSIYLIRNITNGKFYVGKTVRLLSVRLREHMAGYNSTLYLKRAIKKYGPGNFECCILYESDSESELNDREKLYIRIYNTTDPRFGYNLTEGGDGLANPSEAVLEKMRKPHVMTKDGLRRLREIHRGNSYASNMSKAARKKLSRLMRERVRDWVGEDSPHYGLKRTKEAKQKMRKSHSRFLSKLTPQERSRMYGRPNQNLLGYVPSKETRLKISKALKGRHLSKEHRQRISETCKVVFPLIRKAA